MQRVPSAQIADEGGVVFTGPFTSAGNKPMTVMAWLRTSGVSGMAWRTGDLAYMSILDMCNGKKEI